MQAFLEQNKFETTWINDDEDGSKVNEEFEKLSKLARPLAKTKEKALFFIYYSGHGSIMDGMTYAHTTHNSSIPFESKVRKLTMYPNTYVVSLLDCCREVQHQLTSKGMQDEIPEKVPGQLCLIHAVGPTKKAVAVRDSNSVSEV